MSDSEEETRERQTIVSANIMPGTFLLSDAAVEDYLFEEANLTVDKVMALCLTDPLNSHLLTMNNLGYGAIRNHIAAYLRDTEERIRRSVDVAEIRRLEKSLMVATVLREALGRLMMFHSMPLRMKEPSTGQHFFRRRSKLHQVQGEMRIDQFRLHRCATKNAYTDQRSRPHARARILAVLHH